MTKLLFHAFIFFLSITLGSNLKINVSNNSARKISVLIDSALSSIFNVFTDSALSRRVNPPVRKLIDACEVSPPQSLKLVNFKKIIMIIFKVSHEQDIFFKYFLLFPD